MARKRPPLIPIFDSRVREFYNLPSWTWLPLGRALQDEERRSRINELRPSWLGQEVSLLRILDVAMHRGQHRIVPIHREAARRAAVS